MAKAKVKRIPHVMMAASELRPGDVLAGSERIVKRVWRGIAWGRGGGKPPGVNWNVITDKGTETFGHYERIRVRRP